MLRFHLGALETGGLDLGALAFMAYVIAQLLAVIVFHRLSCDAANADECKPKERSRDFWRLTAGKFT
jgi:hypothetical protein